ncbi:alpha/beta fold hydrolase [Limnoglobus roseus]|uniref:Alpha/beta hydrolase n=1 Tax=Limnoglobus roseus TaxID=2598579 RepID=A0A5C1A2X8_9BACT|nr:alpha/beta hydrolase [Limnoglobus roseus]QEL13469.1 alpha/beta hydrolase [Limnoglobus roseus]
MPALNGLLERIRAKAYGRRQPLVLINGLAEQAESWYKNKRFWSRYFEVHTPNFLVYDGEAIHKRIDEKQPVSVDYLVEQLHSYLFNFAQTAPYYLVASSLGGKIAVEFAARYPQMISRMVLICPSGMGDKEQLPIMEGVRREDWNSVVRSVFHRRRFVDREVVRYYKAAVKNRRWKRGLLRTVNDTKEHSVRSLMSKLTVPTLLITALNDKICDPKTAAEAAAEMPAGVGHYLAIPKCGHAPQIERSRKINRLVLSFLTDPSPTAHPSWARKFLVKPTRRESSPARPT